MMSKQWDLWKLKRLLSRYERIAVLTGAGISVDSGIPDFRSPGGVWSRLDPSVLSCQGFESGPEGRKAFWSALWALVDPAAAHRPNPGHEALVDLERQGRLLGVITQNVDGLHQAAGHDPDKVVELHGTVATAHCTACPERFDLEDLKGWYTQKVDDPRCTACGAPVRSDVIAFGDPLPIAAHRQAIRWALDCDAFLVLGSSLGVHPAAELPIHARETGSTLIIVSLGETPLDTLADLKVSASLSEVLPEAVKRRW
ncbi:MAG: SIR2 family NAD-dependent protein deacylase [Bradymonadia bacterium]